MSISIVTYMWLRVRRHIGIILICIVAIALYLYCAPHADIVSDASLNLWRAFGWLDYFGPGQYSPLQWSGHTWWWSWLSFQDDPPLGFLIPHLFFSVFGDTAFVAHVPYIIGFIVSALAAYWFVMRLEGKWMGLLTAAIFLLSTISVYTVLRAYLEGLEIPFIIGSFFSFTWYLKNRDARFFYLGAICTGLALSTKYTSLFLIPSVILLALYRFVPSEDRAPARAAAYIYAVAVIAICSLLSASSALVVIGTWLLLLVRIFQSKEKRYIYLLILSIGLVFISGSLVAVVIVPAFLLLLLAPSIPLSSIAAFARRYGKQYVKGLFLMTLVLSPVIVYNLCLYVLHGSVDSSLAAILGLKNDLNRAPDFMIASGAWTTLKSLYHSGSPVFMLFVSVSFLWLLYKNLHGKASLLEQSTVVYSLFAFLMLSFMGGGERFTAILIPFTALSAAFGIRDLFTYTSRYLAMLLVIFVCGFEILCMVNTIVLPQPVTTLSQVYSSQYLIQDGAYNQLDAYIRSVMAPLPKPITPQRFANVPRDTTVDIPPSVHKIILYDTQFPWFESWWYLERYRVYYRLPVLSTDALLTHPTLFPDYPISAKSIKTWSGTTVYFIYPLLNKNRIRNNYPVSSEGDIFAQTLDANHTPYTLIKNRAGLSEFRVYTISL